MHKIDKLGKDPEKVIVAVSSANTICINCLVRVKETHITEAAYVVDPDFTVKVDESADIKETISSMQFIRLYQEDAITLFTSSKLEKRVNVWSF